MNLYVYPNIEEHENSKKITISILPLTQWTNWLTTIQSRLITSTTSTFETFRKINTYFRFNSTTMMTIETFIFRWTFHIMPTVGEIEIEKLVILLL